uniref:hypothetical protein n=1 Tax=Thaumasiovibrio occultus TaxID=1891184 RepID=UPI000B35D951|nr:hypothetical protein [Thaumasiovibrio occultus]
MKRPTLIAIAITLLLVYGCFLLHNDQIPWLTLQSILTPVYIPLYFVLILIGGLLEMIPSVTAYRGGVMLPYLHDWLWIIGIAVLYPAVALVVRLVNKAFCQPSHLRIVDTERDDAQQ